VNINPAYRPNELEYSLNKVGCKAIIMSETFKSQNYVEMLNEICPELDKCKPGELKSKRVPELRNAILISDKKNLG
jgi:fatty-acyl-CoA synthase